jgi:protein SCO1/2
MKRVFILSLFLSASAFAAPHALPYFDARELTPFWPGEAKYDPATVSPFAAVDQNGEVVNEKSLERRVSVVNFFFASCPNVCPTMMSAIQKFQKSLGSARRDVAILSFSVKPETDPPARLKAYASSYRIDGREWRLLTGKREEIYRIGKEVFKADGSVGEQKSESSFIHTTYAYLVDGQRRIRGIYDTSDRAAMGLLKRDVLALQREQRR